MWGPKLVRVASHHHWTLSLIVSDMYVAVLHRAQSQDVPT